jgi:gamma-glutamyl phosphate reductase
VDARHRGSPDDRDKAHIIIFFFSVTDVIVVAGIKHLAGRRSQTTSMPAHYLLVGNCHPYLKVNPRFTPAML